MRYAQYNDNQCLITVVFARRLLPDHVVEASIVHRLVFFCNRSHAVSGFLLNQTQTSYNNDATDRLTKLRVVLLLRNVSLIREQ